MLPHIPNLSRDQSRLLKLFKELESTDQASLLAFAEFLEQRDSSAETPEELQPPTEPILKPRPENESVVGAIKRLSSSYPMLDKSVLLTDTSSLMTAHLVNGRTAPDVIDDLEQLFIKQYEQYRGGAG